MKVGILALQGCVAPHMTLFEGLGVNCTKVRNAQELSEVSRLVIPGGESTTMLLLLKRSSLFSELVNFARSKPLWGICAGAILIAKEVLNPQQDCLGLMEILATRNHYGSQLESFNESVWIDPLEKDLKAQFIRAPQLRPLSEKVEVLASRNGDAVFLKQNNIIATSFHTELGHDSSLHEFFLGL